jgi:hypothetical protein
MKDLKALQLSGTLVALISIIIALRNSFDEKVYEITLFNPFSGTEIASSKLCSAANHNVS